MKTTLAIEGMHCTSCAMTIDEELEDLTGVKRAKTSYARATSEVEHDPEAVGLEALIAAVRAAGYTATIRAAN